MMPLMKCTYEAPILFSNGHIQTLFPYFFRKINDIEFQRKRILTEDGDFLDIDYSSVDSDSLVILSHGLEGSSSSPYIKGMAKTFLGVGKDVMAWNLRSCSGELNHTRKFYHSASIEDLKAIIDFAIHWRKYKKIALIGFSMGGNITANFLGTYKGKIPSELVAAVIFSAPLDMRSSFFEMQKPMGKMYTENFLITLRKKILDKHEKIGLHDLDLRDLDKIKHFKAFDDRFTAPLHGFKNAEDYWRKASPIYRMINIKLPTLIINAKNDPFLGPDCFPISAANHNKHLYLEMPESGGHVGFVSLPYGQNYWSEQRAKDFLLQCGI